MDVYFNRVSIPGVVKLLNFQAKKSALFYVTVHISRHIYDCLSVWWVKNKINKKRKNLCLPQPNIFINSGLVCG
jgi:hypothetical protein